MHCAVCGNRLDPSARFCPNCGERVPLARAAPGGASGTRSANGVAPLPREELAAAVAARHELGERLESEVTDAFLARVGQSIDRRVDERLAGRTPVRPGVPARAYNFTGRVVASLAVGIPLTAVAGGIGGDAAGGVGGIVGILGALATVVTLNIYYTETEKDLERTRRQS